MNIVEAFANWLQSNNFGTFTTEPRTLFIGGVPEDGPDEAYWLLSGGGANVGKNTTGEKQKNYIISVFYRNTDGKEVYDKLQAIEELINSKECFDLTDHTVIEAEATVFPTDQDLDIDDRTVGMLQTTITAYQNT